MAVTRRHVFFSSENLKLEGAFSFPGDDSLSPGAVICHPHPAYGGDMNNNVVLGIQAGLEEEGFAVLRFNFRGVNQSEGTYDEGRGEVKDVISAISYLKRQVMVDGRRLYVAGYSFGAWVALQSGIQVKGLSAIAGISPPLRMLDFTFLPDLSSPLLLVSGDEDIFCKGGDLDAALLHLKCPKKKVLLPGVDHFYWGMEEELAKVVKKFFVEHR